MMRNILILGAAGLIAQQVIYRLLEQLDAKLTLFLRDEQQLHHLSGHPRICLFAGEVEDQESLYGAMSGQDLVYANLCGNMAAHSQAVVQTMRDTGIRRLVFVTSMGVYDEIPGAPFGSILQPYRDATQIIEQSGLDYTIIRPACLNNRDEISYGTTQKGEAFIHPDATVSRKSVADLIVQVISADYQKYGESIGVHKL
ncbi:NAD(P)H-binding protein [Shewanella fodinae]|jgi:uncharacterized protein YbjT (DUF2867 family)|uniref:Putative NAD(P)-binding protein n=1 Tax=Shewanella fodinae TaxID=552357 RepID=A0A4R2FAH2_9GAMM|nr:NAD(P)H-binding protein [Shewanella fodinae]MDN5370899.1 hypothetical protein [Shewanella sp.]TCN82355.1 putative NAD(P)-binding protein [Shewanella fodinae]